MKYLILTFNLLILFIFCSCSIIGLGDYDEPSGFDPYEMEKEYQENNRVGCLAFAQRNNRSLSYDYNYYTPKEEYGIYISNGVYLTNWHRAATLRGVVVQFEFYFDSKYDLPTDNTNIFYITYRYSPVDTFFTELWNDEIRLNNNTLTEFSPREITIDKYKLEIVSLSVQESYCDSIVYPKYTYYDAVPRYGIKKLWEGSIIVEGNNDYIRKKCEPGHACDGSYSNTTGTLCNDGWVSGSTGSGTCSWHGGIRR